MITRTNAFLTSDNATHASLEAAQARELELLCEETDNEATGQFRTNICKWIVANADKIIDILTTTATSRPKARKTNGGSKKRNNAAAVNAAVQDMKA